MAAVEQMGSRKIVYDLTGRRGWRVWLGDWATWRIDAPPLRSGFPGDDMLRCTRVTVTPEGLTKVGQLGDEYSHCRIEAEYDIEEWIDNLAWPHIEHGADVLDVGGGRKWKSDGAWVNQPINILYGFTVYSYRVRYQTDPTRMLRSLTNKVNSQPWGGAPPGTLYYLGADSDTEWDETVGLPFWRVVVRVKYDAAGHNWAWRSDKGKFDTTDTPLYSSADFSVLGFEPPAG